MLDCGIHPAYNGLAALPFFDEIDPASVDVLLVTHFHLDHAASLPYFMEKTNFRGRVFMTHPTKAIYKWLLSDYVKVSNMSSDDGGLFNEQDLLRSYERIETIDFHQMNDVDGIKFTAYNAGHVLGAAMFLIEIAGIKVLYTGDYSREEDRHLMAAERPPGITPDVLICESTYGVQSNEPRHAREARFTGLIHDTVLRGGRCLIPAFALGRAQELLLILDEFWQAHPELHGVPIYYASSLAKKCMAVYQTYVNMMNTKIRKQFSVSNPFIFKHISNLKSVEQFEDTGPCVMMASPAMLQSGLSRELFEKWCSDRKNSIIIPGYVVEGTLAKHVLGEPDEVTAQDGRKLPLRMKVEYISFSAHVDYTQNAEFIDQIMPPHLVLVHGEANEMFRLKNAIQDKYHDKGDPIKLYSPRNCETVELHFRGEKMAKTIGSLAAVKPRPNQEVRGVLVGKDFQYHIVAATDIEEFTELQNMTITQRQSVRYDGPFELVKFHINQMFGEFEQVDSECLRIMDAVKLQKVARNEIVLEWLGDVVNDVVADSVVSLILQIDSHPASVRETTSPHSHSHDNSHSADMSQRTQFLELVLNAFFDEGMGNVKLDQSGRLIILNVDSVEAQVNIDTLEIKTANADLHTRLKRILQEVMLTCTPVDAPWKWNPSLSPSVQT